MLPRSPQTRPLEEISGCPLYFGGMVCQPTRALTLRYLQGDCGYLALACQALMPNSQIWHVGVGHFAVEDAHGDFWDIRGRMTLAQVWNGMAGSEMTPLDREEVIAALDTGVYGNARFTPSRETAARRVVRDHFPGLQQTPTLRRRRP